MAYAFNDDKSKVNLKDVIKVKKCEILGGAATIAGNSSGDIKFGLKDDNDEFYRQGTIRMLGIVDLRLGGKIHNVATQAIAKPFATRLTHTDYDGASRWTLVISADNPVSAQLDFPISITNVEVAYMEL